MPKSREKRIEELEEKLSPEKKQLTWKELITMARNYQSIPGWEEFIRERIEENNHESKPGETA